MVQLKESANHMISPDGKVFSKRLKRNIKPFLNKPKGYLRFSTMVKGKRKDLYVHILVAKYFIPNTKNLPFVNHIDGNKINNKKANLEWVTASENTQHAYNIGIKIGMIGSKHPMAKLSELDVCEIRGKYLNNQKHGIKTKLSIEYGVSVTHISRVISGQSW